MTKLEEIEAAESRSPFEANRLLFKWLSNDDERADLYRCLLDRDAALKFQSRADTKERPTDSGNSEFHQHVNLLATRSDIEKALATSDDFSNAPYRVLGSGTFMLGLDDGAEHDAQRQFAAAFLAVDRLVIGALSNVAFKAAAVLPLKQRQFDLTELAEQVALRFVGFLFGFAQADHALLETTMRKAYRGLNYQIVGRHFVSEPGAVQEASVAMGALLKRVAELIDLYCKSIGPKQAEELRIVDAELKELREFTDQNRKDPRENRKPLATFEPILRRIARQSEDKRDYSGNELAVIVVGLIAGTVGNVQAGASIAINEFFRDGQRRFQTARDAAIEALKTEQGVDGADRKLLSLIWEALRLNPPAAFLPRRMKRTKRPGSLDQEAGDIVILGIGGATRDKRDDPDSRPDEFRDDRGDADPFIFGGIEKGGGLHQCVGQHLAMPLIAYVVRQVLLLPGLAQSLDPQTGEPFGLQKLWGIVCESYPFEYKRGDLLTQSPLIVIMKVRTPVSEHAEALKRVIKYGAPRIEKKLRDAKHVHFAQFLFVENDTQLVLFTIYDRDFDSYIEHFALEIGPLFDRIFEHIQDAPPMPVDKYPKEFVDTIRRHNARPAGNYFFSAYPLVDVSMIIQEFTRKNT